MDCSTPGFPVHHQHPELTQTHVHQVSDAIQQPHPLSSPSPLPSIFPSIAVFSIELFLHIRWPKYWSFSFSISPSMNIQISQFFPSGGQNIGESASASVLPMNFHDWFSLGLTGLISLQPKGLTRIFFNTTVQKHQFFSAQPSSQSNSHIHTWPQEKP